MQYITQDELGYRVYLYYHLRYIDSFNLTFIPDGDNWVRLAELNGDGSVKGAYFRVRYNKPEHLQRLFAYLKKVLDGILAARNIQPLPLE